MRKKLMFAGFWWLSIFFLIVVVIMFSGSVYAVVAIKMWTFLPILTWGINLFALKKLQVEMKMTTTAFKEEEIKGKVILKNLLRLASGNALCQLTINNTLTGEKQTKIVEIPLSGKKENEENFTVMSKYCGYLCIRLEKVVLTDCFGFLPVLCKVEKEKKISILPDMFPMQLAFGIYSVFSQDAQSWSQDAKGKDTTEILFLRDYVQGDGMRQIHWKMSAKKNDLIVKEGSLPTVRNVLIFWDKNTEHASAVEMDAMAEVVASIGQAVLENGIVFQFGWTEGKSCSFCDIESDEAFIQALPRMIKSGEDLLAKDVALENIKEQGTFGKIIYVSKAEPDHKWELNEENIVFFLCNDSRKDGGIYEFTPENYQRKLEALEL